MTPEEQVRKFREERAREQVRKFREQRKTQQPAQPEAGAFESFQTGVAGPLLRNVLNTAADLYNRPGETLERAGLAGLEFVSAFDPAGAAYEPTVKSQEGRVKELQQRAAADRPEVLRLAELGQQQEEARPRTTGGKIAGTVGRVLGEVAFPTAPESAVANIATIPFGGAAAKVVGQGLRAGISAVGRKFGKGAEQIIEAEATPAAVAQAQRAVPEEIPFRPKLRRELEAPTISPETPIPAPEIPPTIPASTPRTPTVRQKRGQLAPEPGSGGREVRPDPTLYDPLESGGFYEDVAEAATKAPTRREKIVNFLDQQENAARARIQQRRNPAVLRDVTSIVPDVVDYSIIGAAKIGKGTIKYEQFAEEMIKEYGEELRPRIQQIYEDSKKYYQSQIGMSDKQLEKLTAPPSVQAAVSQATESIPTPILERAKNEIFGLLGATKSLKSTLDVSAVLRQGGILTLSPARWGQLRKTIPNMFKAFSSKQFENIKNAINTNPDIAIMDEAGLYLANRADEALGKGEEQFLRAAGSKISEAVQKAPGIKQSEQAYTTFLDTQRVETFGQYKRAIDKAGLSPEETKKGYKAAAEFINVVTGRASLPKSADKVVNFLNYFLFSPRFLASRLQVFNPAMYARNAFSPGGRVVLKEQWKDLLGFAGTAATTMYLLKQAGADVNLNYNSPDFLKVKFGNTRYDGLAGLQQVMRLVFRSRDAIERSLRGEKSKQGESAIDLATTFLSYKLSPPAAVFRDFVNQRTVDKKEFTYGGAAKDLIAPIQWADFVEAYQEAGFGAAAMNIPGVVGIGVQQYDSAPVNAAVEKSQPIFSELQRLNKKVAPLVKKKDESENSFNERVRQFSQNYNQYGLKLMSNPRFQSASDQIKGKALDRLNERAKRMTGREFVFPEMELNPDMLMDAAEAKKPGK